MSERLALVTGGGGGSGAAICRAASRAGYRVAVMDANAEAAQAMAAEPGQAVMFLASDPAAYGHGQDPGVDGRVVHSLLSQIPRE